MQIAHTVEIDLDHEHAIDAGTAALAEQGFGVLTTIDIEATLATKLGEQIDDYTSSAPATPASPTPPSRASPEVGLLVSSRDLPTRVHLLGSPRVITGCVAAPVPPASLTSRAVRSRVEPDRDLPVALGDVGQGAAAGSRSTGWA